jgi:hypothetical protein
METENSINAPKQMPMRLCAALLGMKYATIAVYAPPKP